MATFVGVDEVRASKEIRADIKVNVDSGTSFAKNMIIEVRDLERSL
jgi:hypothetical protein